MLDSGFTSLYSAASAKIRTEIVLRNAINSGILPGPRMRAASPEMVSTGGLADDSLLHLPLQCAQIIADGADEVRRAARMLIREGVDTIKVDLSGGNSVRPGFARKMAYTEPEIAAVAEEAHTRGVWLSCHAQADESVRLALKYKFRMIYHLNYVVDETIEMLVAARDDIYVAPAIGIVYVMAHEGEKWGFTPEAIEAGDFMYMLENCAKAFSILKDEGVKVLPGGDYGFAWNPIGANARDLEHFVNIIGFTPAQALMAATKWGGELMGIPELGLIADGYLADLLVIDGDPVQDIRLLQDRNNIKVIMKDGEYHKRELETVAARASVQRYP
jgi:imidazolonepropionase-like amidohydrolase